jgi:hypothetical protein
MSDHQELFFYVQRDGEMGSYDSSCELLHPDIAKNGSYAAAETASFGICVPEADIDGIAYLVYRAKLGVAYGGAQVFQGVKTEMLQSELLDIRQYMSPECMRNDLWHFKLDSGLEYRIIEPGRKMRLSYSDPFRKNSFDLIVTPASPPVVWPNGRHFESAIRTVGELTLRGRHYDVNSTHIRDRSWEGARLERPEFRPALHWAIGVNAEKLSFNCSGFDHPDLDPEYKGFFDIAPDKVLMGGWLYMDGDVQFLASSRNRVTRNPRTLHPVSAVMDMTDTTGRNLKLKGTVTASAPIYSWLHQRGILALTKWEMDDGTTFWGEIQEGQYTDFINAMLNGRL